MKRRHLAVIGAVCAATLLAVSCASGTGDRSAQSSDTSAQSSDTAVSPTITVQRATVTTTSGPTLARAPATAVTVPSALATTLPVTTVPTTTPPTTTEPRAPATLTLAFTGDVLAHSPLWRQAGRNAANDPVADFDFRPMFADIAPLLGSVDLAICHLETPIAPVGEELSTSPYYGVPAELVTALAWAGFDRCSTASNHVADRGPAGVDRTVDVLEAAGIGQSGMARTPDEIKPSIANVDGVDISHLSYTFSYNGVRSIADEPWRSALIDPDRIRADAATARQLGAELVIVSLHWGEETQHEPTLWQRDIADQITADGNIDLIVGHHAHVLQPIELVNDTWVLFGLGNVLSNHPTSDRWPAASQDAAIAIVTVNVPPDGSDVAVDRPVMHPTWVDIDSGWVITDVIAALDDDLTAGQRGRLEQSLARSREIVGDFLPITSPAT